MNSFAILDLPGLVLGTGVDSGEEVWTSDEFVLGDVENLVRVKDVPLTFLGVVGEVLAFEVHVFGDDHVSLFLNSENDTLVLVDGWSNGVVFGVISPFLGIILVVSFADEDRVRSCDLWSESILTNLDSHLGVALRDEIEAFTVLHTLRIKSLNLRVSIESLLAANKLNFILKV